ncbi:hypothetical protein ACSSL7_23380, partial [Escherichia coli]
SIKTITYLSDIGCLEIQGASLMMMSPVTISTPIKLILFVAMDGWTMLSKGLILQYFDLSINP